MGKEKLLEEKEEGEEKVFIFRGIVEIRIPRGDYEKLRGRYPREHIISYYDKKRLLNRVTGRELVFITRGSGIPLLGHSAFGIIDRGTNLLQVRCISGCNLNCIFCSVDEGRKSRTRKTDFIVDPDYMLDELKKLIEFKGGGVELHLDGQGEPTLYPYLEYFVNEAKKLKGVEVISMQTNGVPLNEEKIDALKDMTRINLSLNALNEETARRLHGNYPLRRIMELAEEIANSKIDLLIAPIHVPGYNDDEIPKIIEFALEIGAGKKYPPLGIQKYIPYKLGRRIDKSISFREFYKKLKGYEEEYGIKLILEPEDFGMEKREPIKSPFRKGEIVSGRIVSDGRIHGEKLCIARDRSISVITDKRVGEWVKFKVLRVKHGIIFGKGL